MQEISWLGAVIGTVGSLVLGAIWYSQDAQCRVRPARRRANEKPTQPPGSKRSQTHVALNPLLIMLLIPLFNFGLYPAIERVTPLTPLKKISIGLFITSISFFFCALVEGWIEDGQTPSIAWQWFAYVIITGAEVLVSVTGLEFSYTQAPRAMKSLIMSLYLMSVSLGNQVTAIVTRLLQNEDGSLVFTSTQAPGPVNKELLEKGVKTMNDVLDHVRPYLK